MKTILDFYRMKQANEKMVMITAYDYPSAKAVEKSGAELILVGDSLGMVMLGYESTTDVTVADMLHHAKAVRRGAKQTFVIVDMPFMSYHISLEESLHNARRLFQETGAQALKVEGASAQVLELTERLTAAGIPVVSHLGLTPQSVNIMGGFKVQGKDHASAHRLIEEAMAIEKSGSVMCVLEGIPEPLAKLITSRLTIPTIGIGASPSCDGQVLVYHDLLQYGTERLAKFVQPYADLNDITTKALHAFVNDVKESKFPTAMHTYQLDPDVTLDGGE
ncbi:3-methyl-2-oxobutanoate hydroxymethyltransferase [Halolactibacillus alkaliphilus]|uniref:3-methyl-2-oxobutanoate hydroxymethyltransferase n=1 Tax=Halolactibacillus alkaliphilus TaxID=442899 RepID=A0A511X146_9BACI|nr:3-methyl-2-oxobutanoate hydroxymethyltransferase [Halolactibacillus alkaliphilus]GEN56674.1 3-methyl-2-oxobutanoate hydroxymethyltransferase [Halolactibacillus alkaliphilus]GGN70197.1 3-methyl-2-oxobutanoate hydroxymethyltransferase [Halolactibacillus alkaliphilus]SFO77528.1 3-methyl-2-oxobutanoate hydroxymethyltransferase [Halolactibacillus alkaliphilus]